MKNNILHLIILVAVVQLFQSCSEDYFLLENPNEISSGEFGKDLGESATILAGVYGAMLHSEVFSLNRSPYYSDEGFPESRANPNTNGRPYYEHRLTPTLALVAGTWDAIYRVIWRSNVLIEKLNEMPDEIKALDAWTEQMGQAKLIRGMMHFNLHSMYNNGQIIIRDKSPDVFVDDFSKAVSSSEDVIEFFRDDLEYAYQNLPAQFDQKSRVDAGLAALLLGKSYLYEKDYASAIPFFEDVLTNSDYGYKLLEGEDVNLLFTTEGDFNSESIFEVNYTLEFQSEDSRFDEESFFNPLARNFAPPPSGLALGGGSDVVPSAWLTHAYTNEILDTQDSRNFAPDRFNPSTSSLRKVSLRASQFVTLISDEITPYYGRENAVSFVPFSANLFSWFKKYTNHDSTDSEFNTAADPFKSGKNIVVERLANTYLMYAECLLNTGNLNGAIDNINIIRKRWGLALIGPDNGSGSDFIDPSDAEYDYSTEEGVMNHLMFIERPLELSVEGFFTRTIDLRRWGIMKQRYVDLAAQTWHHTNYVYTVEVDPVTGAQTNLTRNRAELQAGPNPANENQQFVEFEIAAENVQSETGYLPLPDSETLNNQYAN